LSDSELSAEKAQTTPLSEFVLGVRDELPLLVGTVPFGMIYGALAIGAGLPPLAAQGMSLIVFAGSAQFLMAQLFSLGTPALVVTLAAGIINLRHALYSASLSPYLKPLSDTWKRLLAYLLTDEAYAVSIVHYRRTEAGVRSTGVDLRHWYLLGAGLTLWGSWQLSTAAGILLGGQIPASWPLDFTIALTFIALVVPILKDRPSLASALVAGAISILAFSLPYKLSLVLASLAGILTGLLLERER